MPVRHNKTGRSKTAGPFVRLDSYMLASAAWASLTPVERAIYVELRRRYNGANNGFLGLSARDAAQRCNCNKDTANKALRVLAEKGFIECVTPGGFSRKVPHSTEWRLLDERCDKTGMPPTKAFMRWRPDAWADCKTRSRSKTRSVPSTGTVTPFPLRKRG